jgi:hypothetical protein
MLWPLSFQKLRLCDRAGSNRRFLAHAFSSTRRLRTPEALILSRVCGVAALSAFLTPLDQREPNAGRFELFGR